MTQVNLNTLELNEFIGKHNNNQHCKATFPLIGIHGAKEIATVYFEIEPGDHLGRHTDSAEEILIILHGEAEAEVGNKKGIAKEGDVVLVPKMEPHNLINTGTSKLRVLGVFGGANNIVATFDHDWLPGNSNVVDTSLIGLS